MTSLNHIIQYRLDKELNNKVLPKEFVDNLQKDNIAENEQNSIPFDNINNNFPMNQHPNNNYNLSNNSMVSPVQQEPHIQLNQQNRVNQEQSSSKCKKHPNKVLELYCDYCIMLFCDQCKDLHTLSPHSCKNLSEIPFEEGNKALVKLTGDLATEMQKTETMINDISSKYPSTLSLCVEVDSKINSIKGKIKKRVDEENNKINKVYDELIEKLENFKTTTSIIQMSEPKIHEYMQKIGISYQELVDDLDNKRFFNQDANLNNLLSIKEITPPMKTIKFVISLPSPNVLFSHNFNLYFFNWKFSLMKEAKSENYLMTIENSTNQPLPKEFKCIVFLYFYRNDSTLPVNGKEIEIVSNNNQLCSLYFPQYSTENVGKLYVLTLGIQPKTYEDLAKLLNITMEKSVTQVPKPENTQSTIIGNRNN